MNLDDEPVRVYISTRGAQVSNPRGWKGIDLTGAEPFTVKQCAAEVAGDRRHAGAAVVKGDGRRYGPVARRELGGAGRRAEVENMNTKYDEDKVNRLIQLAAQSPNMRM